MVGPSYRQVYPQDHQEQVNRLQRRLPISLPGHLAAAQVWEALQRLPTLRA